MVLTLERLQQLQEEQLAFDIRVSRQRPPAPSNIVVTGLKLGFKIQWSKVNGVDGYRIAVMSDNNLSAPEVLLPAYGEDTMERDYFVGDVAVTRGFAVQAFSGSLSSGFSSVVSATSKIDGGTADSAPATPPAPAPSPKTGESIVDPGNIPQTKLRNL